jgi:diguanylate cyclase (GGDEF)-like protein
MGFVSAVVGIAVLVGLCVAVCVLLAWNRRLRRRLRCRAEHDLVTGLLNRQGFDRAAEQALRGPATPAALRIDIDPDGAEAGALGCVWSERLLRRAAERIRSAVGEQALVARLDGGHFAVLLVECAADTARAVAGTLLDELTAPYPMDGREVDAGALVGYASGAEAVGEPGATALLRRAELALRRARDSGKRLGDYSPGMEQVFLRRFQLATEFRQAVRAGELLVHY